MKEFTHKNPDHCNPAGAFVDILPHPYDKINRAIEKVVIIEHRFSFFYWFKWYKNLINKRRIKKPPLLVTVDYHRDIAFSESEKEELSNVINYNLSELALFCWSRMNTLNNGHVLAAAYTNVIGDIVLLKRQVGFDDNEENIFKDKFNNDHKIYEFTDVDEFEKHLIERQENSVFFDIDLDYFIVSEGNFLAKDSWEMMKEKNIKEIINLERPFIKWILERLEGYTIATEPRYCGGISKSCKILSIIEEQLFTFDGNWKI
jgi:hypothetical protein